MGKQQRGFSLKQKLLTTRNKVPYRYRVLVFLFFLTFILYLDRISISLLGVRIKSAFSLTNEQFGWVLGAFSLAYALFEIPSGIMGDRIGQRLVLIRIVLWWSVFTALTGFTMGLVSLIIVRFLFGIGEAGAYPNLSGVISRWFPFRETAKSFSAIFVGQSLGAAIAPLIVIPLAASFGWRMPFFVIGLVGMVWVFVCVIWFKNNPSEMAGISDVEQNLIEQNRRFNRHEKEFPWKLILRNRSLRGLVIAFFCSQWANYFFIAWMPVYLQNGRHFSENGMKIFSFYLFISSIAGVIVAGVFSDWLVKKKGLRVGRKSIGISGMITTGLSFLIAANTTSNQVVAISLFIGGLALYSLNGIASFCTCVDIGGSRAGTVAGIMNFFGQTGGFILAMTFGKIADMTHNFNTSMFVLGGVVLTGSLFWVFIDPSTPLIIETMQIPLKRS